MLRNAKDLLLALAQSGLLAAAALVLVLLLGNCANASPWSAVIHTTSWHDTSGDWNESNPGAGVRYTLSPSVSFQAGGYRNSHHRDSAYLITDLLPLRRGPASFGAFAGVVSGYTHGCAVGGLVARVDGRHLGAAVRLVPKVIEEQAGSVITIEFSIRL